MTPHDMRKPSVKGLARKESIVRVATDLFVERGYGETSTAEIASAAGILKGSLYYYFSSKEEILFTVLLRNHHSLSQFVIGDIDYSAEGSLDGLRTFVSRHVTFVLDHLEVSRLYARNVAAVRSVAEWWAPLAMARQAHETFLVDLIRRGQDCGDMWEDEDALLAARAILSMANATQRWHHDSGGSARARIAAHHATLAVRALKASSP